MTRILFVCAGNICRSPMAEGIFRRMLREHGLERAFEVDSCGTGGWHAGESADPRTRQVLARNDADFLHVARQIRAEDFTHFDHIWAMERTNLRDLERAFPAHSGKARLLLEALGFGFLEIPDPYYGDMADFEAVYATLEQALETFFQKQAEGSGQGREANS